MVDADAECTLCENGNISANWESRMLGERLPMNTSLPFKVTFSKEGVLFNSIFVSCKAVFFGLRHFTVYHATWPYG